MVRPGAGSGGAILLQQAFGVGFALLLLGLVAHGVVCRYGGYDKAGWGHGARNVMFSLSPTGDSTEGTVLNAETWIQLESGEQRSRVNL